MKKKLIIAAIVIAIIVGVMLHALHSVLGKLDYCCVIRCRRCCRLGGSHGV